MVKIVCAFCPMTAARAVPGSLPLPIIDRSLTSRTSSHRTISSLPSRRASSAQGCRGISASRAGAARTAAILLLSSYQSDQSYQLPLSATRFGTMHSMTSSGRFLYLCPYNTHLKTNFNDKKNPFLGLACLLYNVELSKYYQQISVVTT